MYRRSLPTHCGCVPFFLSLPCLASGFPFFLHCNVNTAPSHSLNFIFLSFSLFLFLKKKTGTVFVKHLGALGIDGANNFEMLLCTQEGHFHIGAPLIPFDRPPVGVGDLTSGSLLARHLLAVDRGTAGDTVGVEAMEHTTGVYNAVMEATAALNEYELQTVAAQDAIANPVTTFTATRL